MPDFNLIQAYSLATVPAFNTCVAESFAFLPSTYDLRLHSQRLDAVDDLRDTEAAVVYLGDSIEVDVKWDFASATIQVLLVELQAPHLSPTNRYQWGELKDAARMVDVYILAQMLGRADDPDFLLGDTSISDGRKINKRFKVLQTDFPGVIAGLARATERYAKDILRGDTSIFPQVMDFCTQQMRARGFS